jgi:acetate kinase
VDVEAQIENWIVCVEMLVIAFMHHRIFSVEEFVYNRIYADSNAVDNVDNFVDAAPISRQAKLENIKQSVLPKCAQ